jgi:DNA-directed RNA polymerase subunit RPC12/RpoP
MNRTYFRSVGISLFLTLLQMFTLAILSFAQVKLSEAATAVLGAIFIISGVYATIGYILVRLLFVCPSCSEKISLYKIQSPPSIHDEVFDLVWRERCPSCGSRIFN